MGAVATAVSLAWFLKLDWLRRPWITVGAVLSVFVPFVIWDVWVTALGHWSFNPAYTLGIKLGGLPLEELTFFIAIPLVCLSAWQLTGRLGTQPTDQAQAPQPFSRPRWMWVTAAVGWSLALGWSLSWPGRGYSLLAGLAAALTWFTWLWQAKDRRWRRWASYWGGMYVVFFFANTVLTALPIVMYNPEAFSGWRIGTIPAEDWLYNFALITGIAVSYDWLAERYRSKAASRAKA